MKLRELLTVLDLDIPVQVVENAAINPVIHDITDVDDYLYSTCFRDLLDLNVLYVEMINTRQRRVPVMVITVWQKIKREVPDD